MGKSNYKYAIFNSYVCLPEGSSKLVILAFQVLGWTSAEVTKAHHIPSDSM